MSPLRSSAGSSGSRFFSFLATNAHFSSNWASRVLGGKSDLLVVKVAGAEAVIVAVAGLYFLAAVFCMIAAAHAGQGENYRYPWILRLVTH